MIRTYNELIKFKTFKERFEYLKLNGSVGNDTFGFDRYINQKFYRSQQWKTIRDKVIVRDNACDLALNGHDIYGKIIIHHMNPIRVEDILDLNEYLLNPDYLICVSLLTHNAIHYGDYNNLDNEIIQRTKNDTCPWKR